MSSNAIVKAKLPLRAVCQRGKYGGQWVIKDADGDIVGQGTVSSVAFRVNLSRPDVQAARKRAFIAQYGEAA